MSFADPTTRRAFQASSVRAVAAACLGNMLEWYDFVVYASFALQISRAFFSGRSEFTSLLATFITFGVGLFARPVGALLFGNYVDRAGRRAIA